MQRHHIANRVGKSVCGCNTPRDVLVSTEAWTWKHPEEKCPDCSKIYRDRKTNYNLLKTTGDV